MKIVADKHVPFLQGLLDRHADVIYLAPEEITSVVVRDADCLIVRTRTHCDASLLAGSRVRLILTATIGYDHIDTEYCASAGIEWRNSAGCNADGVCDYVESVMRAMHCLIQGKVLGVVGVGEVGGRVCRMATENGMRVLLCDPPRAEREGTAPFVSLREIAEKSDVITFHPTLTKPLSDNTKYPSWHMADAEFFSMTKPEAVIINAARGGVVDEDALLRSGRRCAIDTWENESDINRSLLEYAEIATMHIAGYTVWGKYRATDIVLRELTRFFGMEPIRIPKDIVPLRHSTVFDPRPLSDLLKHDPSAFESLRSSYVLR